MKFHHFTRSAAAVASLLTALSAHALQTFNITAAPNGTVAAISYDAATAFGSTSGARSLGGDRYGFSWGVPADLRVIGGTATFALPDVTVTGGAGWALSGAHIFLGDIIFSEAVAGTTTARLTGMLRVDGGAPVAVAADMDRLIVPASPGSTLGYFSETVAFPTSFHSLSFSGVQLTLTAQPGSTVKSIPSATQYQNELRFSFAAVPVPEPDTYVMLTAGLIAIAVALRRRRPAD